jgi:hypothetical protein
VADEDGPTAMIIRTGSIQRRWFPISKYTTWDKY